MQATSDLSKREIVTTRLFNYPREVMFKAWTDPEHLEQWWGPNGFTNKFNVFELKPDGVWDFIMHGPDGVDYHNKSIFVEILEPERIVFNHLGPIHKFQVTTTFEALGEKTHVTFRMVHDTVEECDKVRPFAIETNEQNFDRLEAHVSKYFKEILKP
jgi:uncharacterized protein YndB with AHSA1/START domain